MVKCVVPWTQLEICNTGYCRPCAEFDRDLVDESGDKFDFNTDISIEDVWQSNDLKNLRQRFLNGEHPDECKKCWLEESQNILSTRQRNLDAFPHHIDSCKNQEAGPIVLLDLKLGIKCNLQCKICNSEYSHNWIKDEQDLFGQIINVQNGNDYTDIDDNWQSIRSTVKNLEAMYLSGGEPLLLENCIKLLEYIVDARVAHNIWLKIHTNGTIRLTPKLLQTLKAFKAVRLMFSIDGTAESFEYTRYPAPWKKVESNFITALQQDWIDLKITYTVSILNCLEGTNFANWCNNIGFSLDNVEVNFLRAPIYYDISMLSDTQKQYIVSNLGSSTIDKEVEKYIKTQHHESIVNKEWKIKNREDLDNLRKYVIMSIDAKKKQSLEQVSPLLAELVDGRYLGNK